MSRSLSSCKSGGIAGSTRPEVHRLLAQRARARWRGLRRVAAGLRRQGVAKDEIERALVGLVRQGTAATAEEARAPVLAALEKRKRAVQRLRRLRHLPRKAEDLARKILSFNQGLKVLAGIGEDEDAWCNARAESWVRVKSALTSDSPALRAAARVVSTLTGQVSDRPTKRKGDPFLQPKDVERFVSYGLREVPQRGRPPKVPVSRLSGIVGMHVRAALREGATAEEIRAGVRFLLDPPARPRRPRVIDPALVSDLRDLVRACDVERAGTRGEQTAFEAAAALLGISERTLCKITARR